MSVFLEFFPNLDVLVVCFQAKSSCSLFLSKFLLNLKISKILSFKAEEKFIVIRFKVKQQTLSQTNTSNSLECKCMQKLTKFETKKTLNLPSDFWFEMTDCWACHREDYTTLKGQEAGLITPKENILMNGISYYLLHPKNMDLEKIEIRLTGRESQFRSIRWVEIICTRCKAPVGEGFMNRCSPTLTTDISDITAFKLLKYRLHDSLSFSHYFVKEVIDMAKAHATYKYVLVDQTTSTPKILFWILNWNSELGVIKGSEIVFKACLKVLFKIVDQDEWSGERIVEQLVLPRECILELSTRMEKSNSIMPTSMRMMKGFKVAMLPY